MYIHIYYIYGMYFNFFKFLLFFKFSYYIQNNNQNATLNSDTNYRLSKV